MREIIFRGKTQTGKWVEGDLIHRDNRPLIYTFGEYWIVSETVGQYTGLKDKNGTKIFEGDILRWLDDDGSIHYVSVKFENGSFFAGTEPLAEVVELETEVLSNTHDNPELIRGEENAEN